MNHPTVRLVIPSFRDARRLSRFLPALLEILPEEFSIRVVDDGSGPSHENELRRLIVGFQSIPSRATLLDPLALPKNSGKASAVYAGWRESHSAAVIAFADADGAVSAAEILRAWQAWPEGGADAMIGSRIKMLGRRVDRLSTRHYAGRLFATAVSVITGLPVYDSQCGFKMVDAKAFAAVDDGRLTGPRLAFDVELLVALTQAGFLIHEFPVDWREIPGGHVRVITHGLPMLVDLLRVRRRLGKIDA